MPQSLYDLEGEHLLSGVEVLSSEGYGYGVVFTLDGVSYEVLEDPDDGYRSHLWRTYGGGTASEVFLPSAARPLCYAPQ